MSVASSRVGSVIVGAVVPIKTVVEPDSILSVPAELTSKWPPAPASPVSAGSSTRAAPFVPWLRLILALSIVIDVTESISKVGVLIAILPIISLSFGFVPTSKSYAPVIFVCNPCTKVWVTLSLTEVVRVLPYISETAPSTETVLVPFLIICVTDPVVRPSHKMVSFLLPLTKTSMSPSTCKL